MSYFSKEQKIGVPVMASYGIGKFIAEFLTGAQGVMVFFFFEKEMQLNAWWAMVSLIIYSVWNAINDPLVGFLTGKGAPLSSKLGRRFPWIMIGLVLCSLSLVSIFAVPTHWRGDGYQLQKFLWLTITLCLFDLMFSLWELNYQAVYPDKFRDDKIRTKAIVVATPIGVIGMTLGFVLPPLFYTYGVRESYLYASCIVAAIALVCSVLIVPGVKESKSMIDRYQRQKQTQQEETKFIDALKGVFKNKNLLALLLCLFFYQSGCMCMTASVNYVVEGVLELPSSATTPIMGGMIVGSLIGVWLWSLIRKKFNSNQKTLVYAALIMGICVIPMTFFRSQIMFLIGMFVWGLGFGGFWTFMTPAMADVVDDYVLKAKKREDGIVMGLRAFFMRFAYASQALVIALCHKLTGYNTAEGATQTELAKWGITMHNGLFPGLFFLTAALVFWRINKLTPEIVAKNAAELKKLDI